MVLNNSSQTWTAALSITEDVLTQLGDRRHGPRLHMVASRIEDVLLEWQWRARTEADRSRVSWLNKEFYAQL